MYFFTKTLLVALLLLLVQEIVPGVFIEDVYVAVIAAFVLGVLNAVVRPILVILTLPITIVTLGLFIFVINAGLFMFAASFLEGFSVANFGSALLASIIVSIGSTIGNRFIRK